MDSKFGAYCGAIEKYSKIFERCIDDDPNFRFELDPWTSLEDINNKVIEILCSLFELVKHQSPKSSDVIFNNDDEISFILVKHLELLPVIEVLTKEFEDDKRRKNKVTSKSPGKEKSDRVE